MAQTTIMVRRENKRRLDRLKEELGAESYDQVISRLLKGLAAPKEELFGTLAGLPLLGEEDRLDDGTYRRRSRMHRVPPGDAPGSRRTGVRRGPG